MQRLPASGSLPRRRLVLGAMVACALPPAAWAAATPPAELRVRVPNARLAGEGRLTWLGLSIYEARLWTQPGFDAARFSEADFALELIYARALDGQRIAERSLTEMERNAKLGEAQRERWLSAMSRLFPDVAAGDRITGLHLRGNGARFFHNGQARGEVPDTAFAGRFFGIWLSAQTSEPSLRKALLGAVPAGS
jgi:hypothetical protein